MIFLDDLQTTFHVSTFRHHDNGIHQVEIIIEHLLHIRQCCCLNPYLRKVCLKEYHRWPALTFDLFICSKECFVLNKQIASQTHIDVVEVGNDRSFLCSNSI